MTLLMHVLEAANQSCFVGLTDAVVASILEAPDSSVQIIRTWLLELFVRGTVPINLAQIRRLFGLITAHDRRQLHLIRDRPSVRAYSAQQVRLLNYFGRGSFSAASGSCWPARTVLILFASALAALRTSSCNGTSWSNSSWLVA